MDNRKDILTQIDHNDGIRVPENYFEDFAVRMARELPDRPELAAPAVTVPRTRWQRLRPYVYMAAMFAGIWCMLKLFTIITGPASSTLENNPIVAEALENETFVNDYVIDDLNQWDVYDDMMEDGIDPQALCDSIFADEPMDTVLQ